MQRLSRPVADMRSHYDVVVVGSGYGGSIVASRLARAGRSVCLMERGREFQPGEYPATLEEGVAEVQYNTPDFHAGSALGLFELHINHEMNAVVGCGLGGTSLINANVALEPDARLWDDPRWPAALRADCATRLAQGYERARQMLNPSPLPADFPHLPKLQALQDSASALGMTDAFYRPPINVTFKDGPNAAGVQQKRCIGCGDCVTGCNHWAKNTTLMNYIPDAVNHGAEVFCGVAVTAVTPHDLHWIVSYREINVGRERFDAPELSVTADVVVLGAGTIGSTEILLRSRASGLPLSGRVGERLSGNGDVLAFAYDTDHEINGVGFGNHPAGEIAPIGPCVAGIIDNRKTANVMDGFVIEEGSLPGALGPVLAEALGAAADVLGDKTKPGWSEWLREGGRAAVSALRGPYHGAIHNTQTYLVMAHDDEGGQITLENDRPRIKWPGAGEQRVFQRINQALIDCTKPLGGKFLPNPIWSKLLGDRLVTVHPLGGCCMAEDAAQGVVDHRGAVFAGETGTAVHNGLYVLDGAIIPLSLGVNPLLTISALAERGAALIAEARGWTIDYAPGTMDVTASQRLGLHFTETMKGFFSTMGTADFAEAEARGKADNSPMEFALTIALDDLDAMLTQSSHEARVSGTVTCPALSPKPLTVSNGRFSLFVEDPARVGSRDMAYRMTLNAEDSKSWFFHGVKLITRASLLESWPQTTTLYVTVSASEDPSSVVAGKGILHILPEDFARQMTTIAVTGAADPTLRLAAIARFGKFFAGVLYDSYGGVLAPYSIFNPDAPPRAKRTLRVGAPEAHHFNTKDDVTLRLTRYRGGDKGPVMLIHGAGVSSGIFSTDLIDTNLLEFLFAHGYDVWLLDFRVSIALPSMQLQSTADDVALLDHFAASAKVRELTGKATIQVVAHCYGATTFTMALLAGLTGVRSVVLSQVSAHLIVKELGQIKAGLHLPDVMASLGVRDLTAYRDTDADWQQRLIDDALRLYPIQHGEQCNSAVCHRITFLYALLFEHARVNPALHGNLHELFAITSVEVFQHLARMARIGHVVSATGEELYLPHPERMALPIRFIHGAQNQCFVPESTARTQAMLSSANRPELYSRIVIEGYGHIDCIFGAKAADDVYPHIVEHLEQTA